MGRWMAANKHADLQLQLSKRENTVGRKQVVPRAAGILEKGRVATQVFPYK